MRYIRKALSLNRSTLRHTQPECSSPSLSQNSLQCSIKATNRDWEQNLTWLRWTIQSIWKMGLVLCGMTLQLRSLIHPTTIKARWCILLQSQDSNSMTIMWTSASSQNSYATFSSLRLSPKAPSLEYPQRRMVRRVSRNQPLEDQQGSSIVRCYRMDLGTCVQAT